jgi:hypothetical protein
MTIYDLNGDKPAYQNEYYEIHNGYRKYKHPISTIPPNKEQELATPPGLGESEI